MINLLHISFTVAFATLVAINPAFAQSILETFADVRFCRTLKDDAQRRLNCFDHLFAERLEKPTTSRRPQPPTAWSINESKSPIDDSPQVTGTLKTVDDDNDILDTALVLRCKEKKTDAIFVQRFTYLGNNGIIVIVRIDSGNPTQSIWNISSDGTGVVADNPIQFIRALPNNGKLFIRALGYTGKIAQGEFNLANVSDIRDKIAQACNWPNLGSKRPKAPEEVVPRTRRQERPKAQKK
jgi:hypothetical protein